MFDILMLFLCVIWHTIWLGNSLQLLCILHFSMLCLSAISVMCVQIMLAVLYVGGYSGLSKIRLCVFCQLCPVSFLVVGESLSFLV